MNDSLLAEQIRRVSAGDLDALQCLIVHYHPFLLNVAAAALDPATARRIDPEDVLQTAYVNAFNAIDECTFDVPAAFYKWLERIILNELKNQQRGARQLKRDVAREARSGSSGPQTSYQDLAERLAVSDTTPSRRLACDEAAAAVVAGLARLSPDQRAALRLRFLEGRAVAETAQRLGKTEDAVHALCYRGLKNLRDSIVSVTRYMSRI